MSAPQVSPWPGLALTDPLINSCLGTDDEGLLYPLLQYTAGSGAERNLEGAGPGWVELGMGRGSATADSMWQPPAGSPLWVGCQSRPAGFPENSFPMSSAALVGHPTHSREPLSRHVCRIPEPSCSLAQGAHSCPHPHKEIHAQCLGKPRAETGLAFSFTPHPHRSFLFLPDIG